MQEPSNQELLESVLQFALQFAPQLVMATVALVRIFATWRQYAIRWVALPPRSMMEIPKGVAARLKTTFDGQPVSNLTRFRFIVHNSGSKALQHMDGTTSKPFLIWDGPGKVLDTRIVARHPHSDLTVRHEGNRMEICWSLFNQRCAVLIELFCDCGASAGDGTVDSEVPNIPQVISKKLYYLDKRDIKELVEKNAATSSGRLRSFRFTMLRFMVVAMRPSIVLSSYASLLVGLYTYALTPDPYSDRALLFGTGGVVATMLVLFYFFRNRYSSLLRKASTSEEPGQQPTTTAQISSEEEHGEKKADPHP